MRFLLPVWAAACVSLCAGNVETLRTPDGGIQPQAVVDAKGTLHLIYMKGEAAADIYYVRRARGAKEFSAPVRVNSQPGSAIAVGTIRGAQLAVGRNGRVHVAWNGSRQAGPQPAGGSMPMLYARLNDAGTGFEPQRNLMQFTRGLDGGGTVAADSRGDVFVAWHGLAEGQGEENRRVWIARSTDDGKTFAREAAAYPENTGACGCCGMRAFASANDTLYMLYRAATGGWERDMVLLVSTDHGLHFRGTRIHKWHLNACPMSSESFAQGAGSVRAAWETEKQVYWTPVNPANDAAFLPVAAPGSGSRKHPALAVDARGETLLAWTEGTGWKKGGALAWQIFDRSGKPVGEMGRAEGVPVWSLAAAVARPEGGFLLIY